MAIPLTENVIANLLGLGTGAITLTELIGNKKAESLITKDFQLLYRSQENYLTRS